jgi:hypothetical protein
MHIVKTISNMVFDLYTIIRDVTHIKIKKGTC